MDVLIMGMQKSGGSDDQLNDMIEVWHSLDGVIA